jgi:hypothetical protein
MQRLHLDLSWFAPHTGNRWHLYGIRDWVLSLNGTTDPINTAREGLRTGNTWHHRYQGCPDAAAGTADMWEPLTTPLTDMCVCLNGKLFKNPGQAFRSREPATDVLDRLQIDAFEQLYVNLDDDGAFDITTRSLEQKLLLLGRLLHEGHLLFPQVADTLTAALDNTTARREAHMVVSAGNPGAELPGATTFLAGNLALDAPDLHPWTADLNELRDRLEAARFPAPDVHTQANYLGGHTTIDNLLQEVTDTGEDICPGELSAAHTALYRHLLNSHLENLRAAHATITGRYALLRPSGSGGSATQIALEAVTYEFKRGHCADDLVLVPLAVVAASVPGSLTSLANTTHGACGHDFVEVAAGTTINDPAVRTVASINGNPQIPLPELWACAHTLAAAH